MIFNKPLSPNDILALLGNHVEYIGYKNTIITGINEIHGVEEGDITFVDHPKYYEKALKSKADFIFLDKKPDDNYGKSLFITDDPFRDYVKSLNIFANLSARHFCSS